MDTELGLRERKKLRTRQLITQTAARLFVKRGFNAVSVAAVARAAEVSEATVFNYFPTKEETWSSRAWRRSRPSCSTPCGTGPPGNRWSPRSPGSCCGPAVSWPRRTSRGPLRCRGLPDDRGQPGPAGPGAGDPGPLHRITWPR